MNYLQGFVKLFVLLSYLNCFSQGFTNIWELGYDAGAPYKKSLLNFNTGQVVVDSINRPMNFRAEESIICDSTGQLLFYTNGIYIANKNHSAMPNGSGLNPGQFTTDWINDGLPIYQGSLILPFPDSIGKYILLHETLDYGSNLRPTLLYKTIIDMSLNNGLGDVSQKNDTLLLRNLDWGGITACRHANGRDWWVLVHKRSSIEFYKVLITPFSMNVDSQSVGGSIGNYGGTSLFSPDGNWFATFDNLTKLRLYNFDRCSGSLSNLLYINLMPDSVLAGGLSYSSNSRFLYASTLTEVYQFDLDAANITASKKLIANYDGYYSPFPPFESNFLFHMLGPDGKIYINGGPSIVDLHVINYPDSLDTLCDLQQHGIHLPGFNKNTFPNHVNYWLGAEPGSPCDTILKIIEDKDFNFNLTLFPNPISDQLLNVYYRMPQKKDGFLNITDMDGRQVYSYKLPMWSTQQSFIIPKLASGIYVVSITSGSNRQIKKLVAE